MISRLLLAFAFLFTWQSAARAADVRPTGYLERGNLENGETGLRFVPDAESGNRFGRYFRVGGYDNLVTYGLGADPIFDVLWPAYGVSPTVHDLIAVSPAGLDRLVRYEDKQAYTEGFCRVGMVILWGAVLAAAGGLTYDRLPGNPREMQPGYWYSVGGAAAFGLAVFGTSTWAAYNNQAILDDAITAYNRDMAGRRKLAPPRSVPIN